MPPTISINIAYRTEPLLIEHITGVDLIEDANSVVYVNGDVARVYINPQYEPETYPYAVDPSACSYALPAYETPLERGIAIVHPWATLKAFHTFIEGTMGGIAIRERTIWYCPVCERQWIVAVAQIADMLGEAYTPLKLSDVLPFRRVDPITIQGYYR